MIANGADRYAQLEARLAELEAAVVILSEELAERVRHELAEHRRQLDLLRELPGVRALLKES